MIIMNQYVLIMLHIDFYNIWWLLIAYGKENLVSQKLSTSYFLWISKFQFHSESYWFINSHKNGSAENDEIWKLSVIWLDKGLRKNRPTKRDTLLFSKYSFAAFGKKRLSRKGCNFKSEHTIRQQVKIIKYNQYSKYMRQGARSTTTHMFFYFR